MKKYRAEFKLVVVQSFLAGEGGAKLLARQWSLPEEKVHTFATVQLLGISSIPGRFRCDIDSAVKPEPRQHLLIEALCLLKLHPMTGVVDEMKPLRRGTRLNGLAHLPPLIPVQDILLAVDALKAHL